MKNSSFVRFIIWFLTVFFFAYQFILRISPGVLMSDITRHFNIDASEFAILASFYYLGYAGMQIPIGLLLDRFGVKYVVSISAMICVLGNIPFIVSDNWILALIGRFFIGFGSAAGALGAFKAVRTNFSNKYVSTLIGWTFTFGITGAIYGSTIINFIAHRFDYNLTMLVLTLPGIVIALLIMLFITDDMNGRNEGDPDKNMLKHLLQVLKNPHIIKLSIFGALLVGPLEVFADIWGAPYFIEEFGFSRDDSGILSTSAIYFGMCIGCPTLAWIVDRYQCHYVMNITCGLVMAVIFYLILEKTISSFYSLLALTFIVGIMCSYQVIVLSLATNITPIYLNGIAISVVNMVNMGAGSAFHFIVGLLLDLNKDTAAEALGNNPYTGAVYADTLYILPITLIVGTLGFIFIKPKKGLC